MNGFIIIINAYWALTQTAIPIKALYSLIHLILINRYEAGPIIIPILQKRKLKLTERVHGHPAGKGGPEFKLPSLWLSEALVPASGVPVAGPEPLGSDRSFLLLCNS